MSQDQNFKALRHCALSSGTTRMIAYVPSDRAVAGNSGMVGERVWEIAHASVEEESSRWVAWYLPFGRVE